MSDNEAKIVDEYHLSIVEKDSFKVVIIKFKCSDDSIHSYEFQPVFAHKFSDETCIAAIRAIAKNG